jgi:hypothetical protein
MRLFVMIIAGLAAVYALGAAFLYYGFRRKLST